MGVLCLVLLPVASRAELYRWVDDKGTINFTEDFQSIPKQFRTSAQSTDDVISTEPAPSEPAGEKAVEQFDDGSRKGSAVVPRYSDKRGEEWRDELRQARAEVKAYQDHLEMKRRMLADTSRMGRREYLGLQNDVKELEVKVDELRGRLDRLERAADRAGVPANFR
jgi:predicted RNase H-like nuclease (RuvC/YqgF family)